VGQFSKSKSVDEPQAPDERPSGFGGEEPTSVEAVLEAECVALMALETSRARIRFLPGHYEAAEVALTGAIELLRDGIVELRARVGGSSPSVLAFGFVIRRGPSSGRTFWEPAPEPAVMPVHAERRI
jgi:hypothetical protein